jgi:hypothetical protein
MDAESLSLDIKFDTILAGDVLEHMNNPGKFLERVPDLLVRGGELIVGVPSALTFNAVKAWVFGSEQVHRDHTFYFSPKTLATLCGRYGLLPVRLVFTVQPRVKGESRAFIFLRNSILQLRKCMAPSFIMHFKHVNDVDQRYAIEWR